MKNSRAGFTLVELLVAMAVFAIASSMALVSFRSSRISGRDARRKADLEQIRSALETYRSDEGGYPLTVEGLNILQASGYLEVPDDPLADGGRAYRYSSDGQTYSLCAALEGEAVSVDCGDLCGGEACSYKVTNP